MTDNRKKPQRSKSKASRSKSKSASGEPAKKSGKPKGKLPHKPKPKGKAVPDGFGKKFDYAQHSKSKASRSKAKSTSGEPAKKTDKPKGKLPHKPKPKGKAVPDGFGKKFDYGNHLDRMVVVYEKLREASLRGGVVPMRHLMELVGNHNRTIHRIKARLANEPYRVSVKYDYANRGYRIINPKAENYLKIGPGLNHHHKVALEVARQALAVFDGAHFADHIREGLEKICGGPMKEKSLGLGVPISTLVSFRTPGAGIAKPSIFTTIMQALLEHRVLETNYNSQSKPMADERLMLEPLHISCVGNKWILIARDRSIQPKDLPIRTYVIYRFSKAIQTKISFSYPDDFNPAHYIRAHFRVHGGAHLSNSVFVKLWFSARMAHHIVERKWHPTLKAKALPAGEVEVSLTISSIWEIKQWIMGYGCDCKVLEPAALRKEVAEEAARMIALYPEAPAT